MLGLKQELDFVLATELVFGDDLGQWTMLVETMKMFSRRSTLCFIANHAKSKGMDGALHKMLLKVFPLSSSAEPCRST